MQHYGIVAKPRHDSTNEENNCSERRFTEVKTLIHVASEGGLVEEKKAGRMALEEHVYQVVH